VAELYKHQAQIQYFQVLHRLAVVMVGIGFQLLVLLVALAAVVALLGLLEGQGILRQLVHHKEIAVVLETLLFLVLVEVVVLEHQEETRLVIMVVLVAQVLHLQYPVLL
jgi:hypothetical protein